MKRENLIENILAVLPYWHYKIDKPFKQSLSNKMSLETYYCLQNLKKEGPATMSELAKKLKITKQQATKTIDTLYQYQFVERVSDPSDRRVIRIHITQKAIDYIEQDFYKNWTFLNRLEERLHTEEITKLNEAITILLDILPKLR